MVLVVHLIACGWYWAGWLDPAKPSWLQTDEGANLAGRGFWFRYLTSVHWAACQLGVGTEDRYQPECELERVYNILVLFFSLVATSYLVGGITNWIARQQLQRQEQAKELSMLR